MTKDFQTTDLSSLLPSPELSASEQKKLRDRLRKRRAYALKHNLEWRDPDPVRDETWSVGGRARTTKRRPQ